MINRHSIMGCSFVSIIIIVIKILNWKKQFANQQHSQYAVRFRYLSLAKKKLISFTTPNRIQIDWFALNLIIKFHLLVLFVVGKSEKLVGKFQKAILIFCRNVKMENFQSIPKTLWFFQSFSIWLSTKYGKALLQSLKEKIREIDYGWTTESGGFCWVFWLIISTTLSTYLVGLRWN